MNKQNTCIMFVFIRTANKKATKGVPVPLTLAFKPIGARLDTMKQHSFGFMVKISVCRI